MPRPNHWREREPQLRAMVGDGVTMAMIAAHFGVKEQCANMACWRLGIRVPPHIKAARSSATRHRQWADPAYRAHITAKSRAAYHAGHGHRLSVKGRGSRLRWLPAEYVDAYFHFTITLDVPAAEARRIILDDFARDLRRALAGIARVAADIDRERRAYDRSFEGQLARAATHGVREVPPMARADYAFSLTGGSLG